VPTEQMAIAGVADFAAATEANGIRLAKARPAMAIQAAKEREIISIGFRL